MGSRKRKRYGTTSNYMDERGRIRSELLSEIGGMEELLRVAETNPYPLVKLAHDCLSRVQYLPVFPEDGPGWPRNTRYDTGEMFVREYVKESLALAEEVVEAGRFGNAMEFIKKAFFTQERSYIATDYEWNSPLRTEAFHLAVAIRFLSGGDFKDFADFVLKPISGAIALASVESAEFAKSVKDFALSVVAKVRNDRSADPEAFDGAKMPRVPNAEVGRAFALLSQLTDLIDENPSVVADIMPKLAELTQLVEHHQPASTERTLNARQAAKRIGISHVRVLELYKQERLGGKVEGKPRFSEAECDVYRESTRKTGRPAKNPDEFP